MRTTTAESTTLIDQLRERIKQATYGRIRDLDVEEVEGRMVVRGQAPSQHSRQLALKGALELISCERFHPRITVG